MDIGSFMEYVIEACQWIEGGSQWNNSRRFRSQDFNTTDFACEWDMEGILHMLEMCSNYPRFALITLRTPRKDCTSDEAARGMLTSDGKSVDFVIGILAIQGHSRVKASTPFRMASIGLERMPDVIPPDKCDQSLEYQKTWTMPRRPGEV